VVQVDTSTDMSLLRASRTMKSFWELHSHSAVFVCVCVFVASSSEDKIKFNHNLSEKSGVKSCRLADRQTDGQIDATCKK
jgi:hypothetical protein